MKITRETVEAIAFGLVAGAMIGALVALIPLAAVGVFMPIKVGAAVGGALGVAWGLAPAKQESGPGN